MESPDLIFMRQAMEMAENSVGVASPNPPVGCVVEQSGEIVGRGWHEFATRDHAEVRALAEAGEKARGSTVYVTLEPCSHYGRTPPCVSALRNAGVRRVVIAQVDPNPEVCGKGIAALRSASIEVVVGPMQTEGARIIEPFACHVTTGLPLVVAKAGMSLDGRIAAAGGRGGYLSSEEGRELGRQLRFQLDAILVGIGTVLADNPRLSYRGEKTKGRRLLPVVLDGMLRTPPEARVFENADKSRVLIFCRAEAPDDRRHALESAGAEIIAVSHDAGGLDLHQVMRELGRRRILGLLVEGGSGIHWSFLSGRLVDKFVFIIAPMILGGLGSVPCVGGAGYPSVGEAPRFRMSRVFQAGTDLVLEAYPSYSRSILSPWIPAPEPVGSPR
jgi:diaminohydroxyphosphoribosylaminopyrimidine deaminase / 5-amino-6-(5-phosphoribosylamino)uracil reductase